MFQQRNFTLAGPLAQNATFILPLDYDEFRLSPAGHVMMIDDNRYVSPTDFTITSDGSGDLTLTWLHTGTIASGKVLRTGIAYIDLMVGGQVGGSGGSTDMTATNTKLDTLITAATNPATINVAQDTAAIMEGATALTPKFKKIDISASADLIALVATKKLRVVGGFIIAAGAVTVKFQSGATSDLTGALSLVANSGFVLPFNPVGYFETVAGEKLNAVLSAAINIAGGLTYIEA